MKNSMTHTVPYAVFALLAILLAIAAANIAQKHPPLFAQPSATQPAPSRQLLLDDGTYFETFNIEASEQGLTPRDIVIHQGDAIQLNITARYSALSIEIPDLKAYLELEQDKESVFSMRADQEGAFRITCKSPCSPKGKQLGNLIVLKR
jgi:heme/copper-type cytochrome/quinol oxidase subunit 2